jgi:hypothetical protein
VGTDRLTDSWPCSYQPIFTKRKGDHIYVYISCEKPRLRNAVECLTVRVGNPVSRSRSRPLHVSGMQHDISPKSCWAKPKQRDTLDFHAN